MSEGNVWQCHGTRDRQHRNQTLIVRNCLDLSRSLVSVLPVSTSSAGQTMQDRSTGALMHRTGDSIMSFHASLASVTYGCVVSLRPSQKVTKSGS